MTESDQESGVVVVESKAEGEEEEVVNKGGNDDGDSIDELLGDVGDNHVEDQEVGASQEEGEGEEYEEGDEHEEGGEYEEGEYEEGEYEEGDDYEEEDDYEEDDYYEGDTETEYEDYDSMSRTTSFDAISERLYAEAAERERRRAELVEYYEIQQEEEMTFSPQLATKASSRPSTTGMHGSVHDSLYNRAKAKQHRDKERRRLAEQAKKGTAGGRSRKESERIAQEMYDKSMKRMEEIHRRRAQAAQELRPSFTPELATKGRRSTTPPSATNRRTNGARNGSTSPSKEAAERLYTTAQKMQLRKEERKRRAVAQENQNYTFAPDVNGRNSAMAYAPQDGEAHPDPRSLPVWDKLYEISKNQHKKVYSPPSSNGAGAATRPKSSQKQTAPSSGTSRWERLYQAGVEKERHKKHLDELSDVVPAAPKTSAEGLLAARPSPSPKHQTTSAGSTSSPTTGARSTSRIPRFTEKHTQTSPQPAGILRNKFSSPRASPQTPPSSRKTPTGSQHNDDLDDVLGNETIGVDQSIVAETDDEDDIAEMLEAAKPPSNLTAAEVGQASVGSSAHSSVATSEALEGEVAATTNGRNMSDKGRTSSSSLSSPSSTGGMLKRLISRSSSVESPVSPTKSHKRVVVEARLALAGSPPQSPVSPHSNQKQAVTKAPQAAKRRSNGNNDNKPPASPSSAPGDWRSMGAAFARAAAAEQSKPAVAAPESAAVTSAPTSGVPPTPPQVKTSPEVSTPKQVTAKTPEAGMKTPPSRPNPPVKSSSHSSHMSLSSQEATPRAKNGKGGGFVVWKSSVSAAISRSKQKSSRRPNRGRGRGPVDVDDIPQEDDDMMAKLAMPSTDGLGDGREDGGDTLGELPSSSSPRVVVGLQQVLADSHQKKEGRMAMTDDEQDAASATSSVRSTTRDGSIPSKTKKKKRRGFGRVKFW